MFKKHPKGLFPAILVNMSARFAFFALVSVLLLFLEMKLSLSLENAGFVYSVFYSSIFVLSLVGGMIADKKRNYKGTVSKGLILMAFGYFTLIFLIFPTQSWVVFVVTGVALLLIAFGCGLFNGNLRAMIGQMYDEADYSQMRDSGFLLSSLFVNISVLIAPLAVRAIRSGWMSYKGFVYDSNFLSHCFVYTDNGENITDSYFIQDMAAKAGQGTMKLSEFVNQYLQAFNIGLAFIFALAGVAMIISIILFLLNEKKFSTSAKLEIQAPKMDVKLLRRRAYAFLAFFGVLNLFYFAFNQDAFTLGLFSRDYTNIWHNGLNSNTVNIIFAILLTPIILIIFRILLRKGKELSTLKKMAVGMGIAAVAYIILMLGSIGLPDSDIIRGMGVREHLETQDISSFFLLITLFILAIADLFISPLISSFISQYARPKHQGIMQVVSLPSSVFFANIILPLSIVMYMHLPLWATWIIFAAVCLISMITLLRILKWVEKTLQLE